MRCDFARIEDDDDDKNPITISIRMRIRKKSRFNNFMGLLYHATSPIVMRWELAVANALRAEVPM